MKRRIFLSLFLAAGVAITALTSTFGTTNAANVSKSQPFSVACSSSGQVCAESYTQTVTTSSVLILEFQSEYTGCGDFSVTFRLDGVQVYSSPVLTPFATTGPIDLSPVSFGSHQLEIRATGVAGGCNTGTLTEWAGRLDMSTTTDLPPEPPPPPSNEEVESSASICKKDGWRSLGEPPYRNQGQCVSDRSGKANDAPGRNREKKSAPAVR
jgi:hypothetical protein